MGGLRAARSLGGGLLGRRGERFELKGRYDSPAPYLVTSPSSYLYAEMNQKGVVVSPTPRDIGDVGDVGRQRRFGGSLYSPSTSRVAIHN